MKYYLHDSNAFNDEKITELYLKFGYEGLGLFYTALEKFASQEKPIKTSVIKSQLNVKKRLEKCWKFMEEIGIISSSNGDSFNKELLNYSEKYQIRKEKNAKKVAEWRLKQQNVTGYEPVSNLPKVKLSKVNKSKVNTTVPPSGTNTVFNYFCLKYKETLKVDYVANFGKDKKLVKDLLGVVKEDDLLPLIDNFFKSDDEFIQKSGYTLGVFKSQINKLRGKKSADPWAGCYKKEK
jgi:hypothetical protein